MAPNFGEPILTNGNTENGNAVKIKESQYKLEILWPMVIGFTTLHVLAALGFWYIVNGNCSLNGWFFFNIIAVLSAVLGINCGYHRLWSHRSYKAKLPLRIFLMIFNTIAFETTIINLSRDHRVHHKHSDTDADPYNASRGFFFCHMGWLMVKKHPDVKKYGSQIDVSDLVNDPVLRFQQKYYYPLVALLCFAFPISIAMYFFGLTFWTAFCVNNFRWVCVMHLSFTVNSFAHFYGIRPYDQSIRPVNSPLCMFWALGEGYHNYHHVFPYDYSASEFGWESCWNPATAFIDFFAWIGQATDLKRAPKVTVTKRTEKTGDVELLKQSSNFNFWFEMVKGFLGMFFVLLICAVLQTLYKMFA